MCKHILINEFKKSDTEVLRKFVERTSDRDGFGAILRLQDGTIETLKSLSAGGFYIELLGQIQSKPIQTLVVHHRTSTNKAGLSYAHPFEYAGNYLTHNGVVDVPGTHETSTSNDSEALLHHLIKSGYETESIQGYFSCFILNKDETIVLVDAIAPIFTDGRVYCSHKLSEEYKPIELHKLTLDPMTGKVLDAQEIAVTASVYGLGMASKSLGSSQGWGNSWDYDIPLPVHENEKLDMFLSMLTAKEEDALFDAKDFKSLRKLVKQLTHELGIPVSRDELTEFAEFFI